MKAVTPADMPSEPIAALATPWGESAIGVVRISGGNCLSLLDGLFRPAGKWGLAQSRGYTLRLGRIYAGERDVDEVLVAVYRSPRSYTGENSAEIYCHGGMSIIQEILKLLLASGFRQAHPGEFTQRAFLNGKMDLTRAEAVNEIIRAKTDRARALALRRLSGDIEQAVGRIKNDVVGLSAAIEVQIDYPDDDLPDAPVEVSAVSEIEGRLERLLETYRTGKILQEGIGVAVTGRTNSGKSTLFNLLLREERAIVSDIHGTTRDYLEGAIAIEGIPIRLYDTAGWRDSTDPLEIAGMQRTEQVLKGAGLILFLVDAVRGLEEEDRALMERYGRETAVIPVWNKTDLTSAACPDGLLPISSRTGSGLGQLHNAIAAQILRGHMADCGEPVIDSARQKAGLERCLASLRSFRAGIEARLPLDMLAVDLREALDSLGEITGKVFSEQIIREMFSRFCVGK